MKQTQNGEVVVRKWRVVVGFNHLNKATTSFLQYLTFHKSLSSLPSSHSAQYQLKIKQVTSSFYCMNVIYFFNYNFWVSYIYII